MGHSIMHAVFAYRNNSTYVCAVIANILDSIFGNRLRATVRRITTTLPSCANLCTDLNYALLLIINCYG